MTDRPDPAAEIRRYLTDPAKLCRVLGLTESATQQGDGMVVCCPAHGERNPSCSVTKGPDGTVRVKCFACELAGDGFHLVAAVHQLDCTRDWVEVMALTAEALGLCEIADEVRNGREPSGERKPPPEPTPEPEKVYPPELEVLRLWGDAGFVNEDREASACLVARKIDPDIVTVKDLARVIRKDQALPRWARYRGKDEEARTWIETGHRLLLPVYDHQGQHRSVRAWRVRNGASPKRLPPSGHKQQGLVLANREAVRMLQGEHAPVRLVVSEGEPDWTCWAVRYSGPVVGIGSGSWTPEFAAKVPLGSQVLVRTDVDDAGDKYARQVIESLKGRCVINRLQP